MVNRNNIPPLLRNAHSKLRQLINQGNFIKGSLYYLRNTCGKKNCKCYKGEKHESLYIQQVKNKVSRKSIVPKSKWEEVKQMNKRYKEIQNLIEQLSDYQWDNLKNKK